MLLKNIHLKLQLKEAQNDSLENVFSVLKSKEWNGVSHHPVKT
jgi:hypothetical protein